MVNPFSGHTNLLAYFIFYLGNMCWVLNALEKDWAQFTSSFLISLCKGEGLLWKGKWMSCRGFTSCNEVQWSIYFLLVCAVVILGYLKFGEHYTVTFSLIHLYHFASIFIVRNVLLRECYKSCSSCVHLTSLKIGKLVQLIKTSRKCWENSKLTI